MTRIAICPKCRSPDIRQSSNVSGWLMPDEWECDKCGYIGTFVQEIDTKDVEKEPKKKGKA